MNKINKISHKNSFHNNNINKSQYNVHDNSMSNPINNLDE